MDHYRPLWGQGDALLLLATVPNALLYLHISVSWKNCGERLSHPVLHQHQVTDTPECEVRLELKLTTPVLKSRNHGMHIANLKCAIRLIQIFITFPLKGAKKKKYNPIKPLI